MKKYSNDGKNSLIYFVNEILCRITEERENKKRQYNLVPDDATKNKTIQWHIVIDNK